MLLETDDAVIEAAAEARKALGRYGQGADFAGALHLAACGPAVMHTCDRNSSEATVLMVIIGQAVAGEPVMAGPTVGARQHSAGQVV